MSELKRSDYLAAAKDLINVMGLKDDDGKPLTIGAKSGADELKKFILECTAEIDPETDEFEDATLTVLSALGYKGFDTEEEETPEAEETPTPAKKVELPVKQEDDWVEPEPRTLRARVATTFKLAELKDLVTDNPEFKKLVPKLASFTGLNGPRELKAAMQAIVGTPTVTTPEKPKGVRGFQRSPEATKRKEAIEAMITAGTFTAKQITEKIAEQFSVAPSSIQTMLSDGKNPKYNKFSQLVKKDANGILSF